MVYTATNGGEHEVPGHYRQGIAKAADGWIFTTDDGIYATDDGFAPTTSNPKAIPAELSAQTFDHLGDGDVADGVLWVPLEKADKSQPGMVTARYDARTLAFEDSFVVPQHHNAWVSVDDGTLYSADKFTDDTILRYTVDGTSVTPKAPLKMNRTVERIQGGDVADGALWLSTDDDDNGVYRVDLETGEVQDLGSAGHTPGEGEGDDATQLLTGLVHVLVADEKIVPMWVEDLEITSAPR
jgi:hypothetical protein